jgi:MoxR-like ATPase
VLSYDALADDVPADHIVARIMQTVPMPSVASRQGASPNGHAVPTSGVPATPAGAAWPGQQ